MSKQWKPEIQWWPTSKLIPYARNSKRHPTEQVQKIVASVHANKFIQPIVVDREGVIVTGHGRKLAAEQLNMQEVPVIVADHLDEHQIAAYRIADNRVGQSEWDDEMLSFELGSLDIRGMDLTLTGFDLPELQDLLPDDSETKQRLDQEQDAVDAAADAIPGKAGEVITGVVRGDVWKLGAHRLMCGDSTDPAEVERLMSGQLADVLFTDPPYGVSFVGVKGTMYREGALVGADTSREIMGDGLRGAELSGLFKDALTSAARFVSEDAAVYIFFGINRSLETLSALKDVGLEIRNWLIWDKGNVGSHAMGAQYKPNFEAFLYCHKKGQSPKWSGDNTQQTIWRHSVERLGIHPTTKPVALVEQALANHPSSRVLDLFGGSGSTLIACEKTGRACRMMELDTHYVGVILRRWCEFTGLDATRESDGALWSDVMEISEAADVLPTPGDT